MKVHLVDGTFELFRCFHGAPRALNDLGEEVGAARGLLQTFIALLRQEDVTHLAVAFDTVVVPGRAAGDPLASQHPLAADVVRALGIVMWPMIRRFEGDDALATGAAMFKNAPGVEQVVLCTTDKDLAQCVEGERVVLLDRIRKRVLDESGVVAKFGVPPAAIPEYLALVGDAADGIPGIPGWGPKSSAALLTRYGSVAAIPTTEQEWDVPVRGAERLAKALAERRQEAILYRNLCELSEAVPIPTTLEELEWRGADRELCDALVDRIGEREVLERIPGWRAASPG